MGLAEQKPFEELSDFTRWHSALLQNTTPKLRCEAEETFPLWLLFCQIWWSQADFTPISNKDRKASQGSIRVSRRKVLELLSRNLSPSHAPGWCWGGHSFWGCKAALQSISPSHSQKNQLVEALRNLSCESGWSGHLYRIAGLGSSARTWEGSSLG